MNRQQKAKRTAGRAAAMAVTLRRGLVLVVLRELVRY